ncbi:MAG: MBL fold metallo-hydrolase [Candidatus Tectomicrobia bacterium]|nr:MBL fold metallo-hydrolase [Candidatus Tectomicrobia bacterium]
MATPSPTTVELDELRLLIVVDNETDTLSSIDDGVPQLPEVASLISRVPSVYDFDGHDCKPVFEHLCCACHGFSVLVTGRQGQREHTILFDVGPYADIWLANAKRLDIDLAQIETIFLSHWHADHSAGIPQVTEAITSSRRQAGLSDPVLVDLHPDRPDRRGIMLPTGTMILLPDEPTFTAIQSAGGRVETHGQAHVLCNGFFFASGEIERQTAYENGLAGHHTFRGDEVTPDPLIMDERYVAARVQGRGVSVLSACSHAGVVNACLDAQRAFDQTPIDMILGGYHLAGKAMEERIPETVRDLAGLIEPRVVAPGHCTGWRAKAALCEAFSPGRYAPSVVGSLYSLQAE